MYTFHLNTPKFILNVVHITFKSCFPYTLNGNYTYHFIQCLNPYQIKSVLASKELRTHFVHLSLNSALNKLSEDNSSTVKVTQLKSAHHYFLNNTRTDKNMLKPGHYPTPCGFLHYTDFNT